MAKQIVEGGCMILVFTMIKLILMKDVTKMD
jgi:hypothetical protein